MLSYPLRHAVLPILAAAWLALSPATAAPLTYHFQATTGAVGPGANQPASGSFVYDTAAPTTAPTTYRFDIAGTIFDSQVSNFAQVFPFTGTSPVGSFLDFRFFGEPPKSLILVFNAALTAFYPNVAVDGGGARSICIGLASESCTPAGLTFAGGSISVPEPASLALLLGGLLGLAGMRPRRR